jgi:4-hydroxybutyryl-CoA dehydratase/vinylacetyl-CoA-Delta-isomerase
MMTGDEYKASLADGRAVYFRGERIADVVSHPVFAPVVERVAEGYDKLKAGGPGGAYFEPPRTRDDLRRLARAEIDPVAGFTQTSLMTLVTAAERIAARRPEAPAAVAAYVREARARDWRIAECISDSKGDRGKHPGEQPDPDQYVRVVERRADGVVIRGAKLHISAAAFCHELMTIPTKAMRKGEEDYAIACCVPANAPGVHIVNTMSGPKTGDLRDSPLSSQRQMPQGFVIFDDVFVPKDRVFLDGESDCAAAFAHSLGLWTRAANLADACEEADLIVGFAQLIAEANGLEKLQHIRDKISDLIISATLTRACFEAAIANSRAGENGVMAPDELFTNAGKYQSTAAHAAMIQNLQDICGASLITAPSIADLESEAMGQFIRKYMGTKQQVDGAYRLKLFQAIRDLAASEFSAHRAVAKLHGGGGLYAQRVVTRGRYDLERAKRLALEAAGLEAP